MLRFHFDVMNHHAFVGGFAHVIDGQQGDLDCRKGFHFHPGGPGRFYSGHTPDAWLVSFKLKIHRHTRQRQWMT